MKDCKRCKSKEVCDNSKCNKKHCEACNEFREVILS